jgi:uroporphyrinogen-III synthase
VSNVGEQKGGLVGRGSESEIGFLHEIGSRFAAADPLQTVLNRVVNFVSSVVQCDSCFIYVLNEDELVLRASKNPHTDLVDRLKPVLCRGRLVAVINLQHRDPHEHTWEEIQLITTIGFLVGAEIELARLESANSQLSERLETRKVVDRAKGILQRDLGISEEEAYLTIQRQSRQRRRSKREIAEAILLADDLHRGRGGS